MSPDTDGPRPPAPVRSLTTAMRSLTTLLEHVVRTEASDLHLRPDAVAKIRVDGELVPATAAPLTATQVGELVEAAMTDDVREVFATEMEADFALVVEGVGRFRVNAFRTRGQAACVMRRIREKPISIDDLEMPTSVHDLALRPRGLVLVTGPTGSGKSTTLAAMVDLVNRKRAVHILTLEDPIEVMHPDQLASVTQRELGSDTRTWTAALKSAMRQDPDVILIGELRDAETVHAALAAAETGHLVLASMHTSDTRETVTRVIEFFPAAEQARVRAVLSTSLEGVVCQRLVPRIDASGRVCVVEVGVRDARLAEAIADPDRTHLIPDILADGEYSGMQTFDQHLVRLVLGGTIDVDTARANASNAHDLTVMLRRAGWTQLPSAAS